MPDTPPLSPSGGTARLRARVAELVAENARLREAAAARDELAAAQLAARDAQLQALVARVEELERRLGKDSSTSSKPPSSDSPYKKKSRDRSLRGRSGRRPGKQPGAQSSTLKQSGDPGQRVECAPAACGCCGADLGDAAVIGVQKRQVFEASPPPPPTVVEYQVQAKACGRCGAVTEGVAPAHATGRAQYGPLVHAKSALAVCAHYLPAGRAAALVASLTGVKVPAGFMAGSAARPRAGWSRSWTGSASCCAPPGCCTPTRPRPGPAGTCTTCTSPAPSSSPPCTPAAAPPMTSTPGTCFPAMPARSSATATPATSTCPAPCTPGAARTASEISGTCTPSTPAGRSGPAPWPTC